jgi:2-methylisocitrate lyase-like PEP mutase family enzyme
LTIHTQPTASKFERFRNLHKTFFVIPTIWDSLSAVAAADASFEAVATSSAALGYAHGILSSERASFDKVVAWLKDIVDAVDIPVSIDMEDGYPGHAGDVTESIRRIIDAGVVAANIEDSPGSHGVPLVSADHHARSIERARKAAGKAGVDFFINARTDVFLLEGGLEHARSVEEAVRRANLYLEAGADGVYVPAQHLDDSEVAALADGIRGPLTLLAPADGWSFAQWEDLGVKRVSLGTAVIRNAYSAIQTQLETLRAQKAVPKFAPVDLDAILRRGPARIDRSFGTSA